jgi:hypothetical protein
MQIPKHQGKSLPDFIARSVAILAPICFCWSAIAQEEEESEEDDVEAVAQFLEEHAPELAKHWEEVIEEEPEEFDDIVEEARELIQRYEERWEHQGREVAKAWLKLEEMERMNRVMADELRELYADDKNDAAVALKERLQSRLKNMVALRLTVMKAEAKALEAEIVEVRGEIEELEGNADEFVQERFSELMEDREEEEEREDDDVEPRVDPFRERGAVISLNDLDSHPNPSSLKEKALLVMENHCLECHDAETRKGDLDIERALSELPLVRNGALWENVIARLRNKEMPPAEKKAPTPDEYLTAATWVRRQLSDFDYSKVDNPGNESARRLSHREYSNTLTDLFDIEIDVVADFPQDLSGTSGFENSANSLFMQPLLVERYITSAEDALDRGFEENPKRILASENVDEVFASFLTRAWRREVKPAELKPFQDRYTAAKKSGRSHAEAAKIALRPALLAPAFLMRVEENRESAEAYRITDWELASRLSYFLWASMPDDELFRLAESGTLHEPDVVRAQVTRMLADERSHSLGDIFAAQWLKFADLGTRIRRDPIDNPWCTETLMSAMRDETSLFIHSLIAENQPLHRLIDADYTFINEELAGHYKMPGIRGDHMQRITLDANSPRGGLFGQGSILAVTSFPNRTSPVVRGNWILTEVLGTPPPPPPPDAGTLEETVGRKRKLSPREKLELHRANPRCAACHQEMDPLGLSLENFDYFGRWRESGGRGRVDAKGQLPDGTEFEGVSGLKEVIVTSRLKDVAKQTTRKFLTYGLGRQLEYYDEPVVRKIIADTEANGYRLQEILFGVINSYPFQWKKQAYRN